VGKQTSFEVEVAKHEALGEFEQRVLHDDLPTSVPVGDIDVTDDEIQKDAA